MCMSLTHRLQLLLDEEQYQRLAHRASGEGRSVGSLVREAIDLAWTQPDAQRRIAADRILAAPPLPVSDPGELKAELDVIRSGRFA